MRILILGGTGEARALAERLVDAGHEVITSLAGRTEAPLLPPGEIRVGKFGGVPGLVGYLRAAAIEHLIDATHPYAGLISDNAVAAAKQAGVPLIRLTRPAWQEPAGVRWIHVPDVGQAARLLRSGGTVLVTSGSEGLEHLLARTDCEFVVRLIEPPGAQLPLHARLLIGRPPHSLDSERDLLHRESVTQLVTKNSGGAQTHAKLDAAAELGVEVIMIDRPTLPKATEVATVDEAIAAIPRG